MTHIIELLLLTVSSACAASFLHYCIGSPIQGEFYSGRIFSDYGRFISRKYLEFEDAEHKRVWNKYGAWKQKRDEKLERELLGLTANQAQMVYDEYLQQVDAVYKDVENGMRANPYSMLGACPICFSTWISFFCFIFFIIFVPLPWWFIFAGTPAAVVLSRYLKIT